ncbi:MULTISPECIES: regulatory protein RecX [Microbacterium]|uniref:regulatory protein RecX n=1 Tax=Microbacterium TaxID=33882 RepID=UPI0027850A57|nr:MULTISPECIES: RecX family transcriptional regulator [Microbacterium]MDQ1083515.1 regulatory protein [Microbacterium sp. SORGH_AS_0344]MDQ1171207.1 regulatory protein [Microbacterium proteolyticum]
MTDDDNDSGRRPVTASGGRGGVGRSSSGAADGERVIRGLPRAGAGDALAPVIPLFGARDRSVAAHPSVGRDRTTPSVGRNRATPVSGAAAGDTVDVEGRPPGRPPRLRPLREVGSSIHDDDRFAVRGHHEGNHGAAPGDEATWAEAREQAEAVLLRKLRSRSLSLSEARGVLRGIEGVDDVIVEEIIDRFVDLGYLDDATVAEQLAMSAVEKKGEGRRAVAETLRKRGIPRDIADAALAALPDDDADRALDFARSKVRGVVGADFDTALRRLAGQLGRRGYPSSVALTAARTALDEAGIGRARSFARPASGVRFTPDE